MTKTLSTALKLVAAYAVVGALWIALSDAALQELAGTDINQLSRLQSYKGWFFIALTSVLLFVLSYYFLRQITRLQELDPQTSLPRHTLFLTHLDDVLQAPDGSTRPFLVLFLDIDRFNDLTARIGRQPADAFTIRFGEALRAGHSADALLSRLGSDEFAVAIPLDNSGRPHKYHTTRLRALFNRVARESGLDLTCSIGAALAPDDGREASVLLSAAGKALRASRPLGTDQISYFNEQWDKLEKNRRSLLQDLRRAIDNADLQVLYQPQLHLQQQRISGCEVLARWHCPTRGAVPPDEFIPLAEEHHLIAPLTRLVIMKSCTELGEAGLLGAPLPRVSVNISAQEFTDHAFLPQMQALLAELHALPPYLQLEITERAALSDIQRSIKHVGTLREQGLRFSIDDFGTGYSGLSLLRDLPVDELKIDRSFIVDLQSQPRSAAIVRAIIGLADNFGLSVVAEGVENASQMEALHQCHCEEVQGYWIAPPLDITAFSNFLHQTPAHLQGRA
ncbi:putative bifunctional diguanylate cyclase/phosphodiesterase [Parahaliea mediterranea]|uniref:putative bifunctional diguanylate cyclase/phosphodiesterase n=1 Tax=Parahaliea mediterranea TaxID=651086 RepID=UPI001472B650|nr:GGDEF domain-containing phosphodiesterase [Parahaliea mediterranea]